MGKWKTNGVDYRCLNNKALVQFSCKNKATATTKVVKNGTFGYAKDSGQYTKCGSITKTNTYTTCNKPVVTWGKHTGYPHKHSNNNFNNYCKSLGYTKGSYGTPKYGTVKCSKGALFWCKGYDNPKAYHWCDWQDGKWKTNGLHYRCLDNRALVQFSCKGKTTTTQKATTKKVVLKTFGYAKDSGQYTKCGSITKTKTYTTCNKPVVTWGKHTGYPHKHSNNNFNNYCKSLGYPASYGTPKYGTVKCSKGALFWCKGYDNPKAYHWCDWQDGKWKNNGVDYR